MISPTSQRVYIYAYKLLPFNWLEHRLEAGPEVYILVIIEMPINIAATALLAVLAALLCMPPATVVAAIRWVEEEDGAPRQVSLDARALVVDGTRRLLFAGEMHYTRSTPEVSARRCLVGKNATEKM